MAGRIFQPLVRLLQLPRTRLDLGLQFLGVPSDLLEEAGVLDGDCGLVCQSTQELLVFVTEFSWYAAVNVKDPDDRGVKFQRHCHR